jgi:hypothetical protein
VPGGSVSSSSGKLFLAPGVAALYDVSDNIFLGVDARFQIIFGGSGSPGSPSTFKSLIFLANGGMRF